MAGFDRAKAANPSIDWEWRREWARRLVELDRWLKTEEGQRMCPGGSVDWSKATSTPDP